MGQLKKKKNNTASVKASLSARGRGDRFLIPMKIVIITSIKRPTSTWHDFEISVIEYNVMW